MKIRHSLVLTVLGLGQSTMLLAAAPPPLAREASIALGYGGTTGNTDTTTFNTEFSLAYCF